MTSSYIMFFLLFVENCSVSAERIIPMFIVCVTFGISLPFRVQWYPSSILSLYLGGGIVSTTLFNSWRRRYSKPL